MRFAVVLFTRNDAFQPVAAPEVASIHYNIAQAYEAGGIPNEAEYEYERALQIDPDYAKAQEALGSLKKRLHHI